MKRLTYSQGLGVLSCKNGFLVTGYAGFETGKNNPAMDHVKNVGPIPRGLYRIVPEPFDHAKCGKFCIRLTPEPSNVMHGRAGFLIHGDNGKSGAYAHVNYMKQRKGSVVIGHVHSYAGVNYEGDHFGMNTGCLIDKTAYCFKYAKNMLNSVNLGCGIVINGKAAHFLPMHLDKHDRWMGKL
jgi:hypothetical protein